MGLAVFVYGCSIVDALLTILHLQEGGMRSLYELALGYGTVLIAHLVPAIRLV
jgi:hypothetical protein